MARILIVGAGVSGCAAAYTLASGGVDVILIEKAGRIGGRVRTYGCKAVEKCRNCGVCLTAGMWDKVMSHPNIQIYTWSDILDVKGRPGDFSVNILNVNDRSEQQLDGVDAILISTGFDSLPDVFPAHLHIESTKGLMTGTALEELMLDRTRTSLFDEEPKSVAFIQCLGSRDKNEGGLYCSRVCCSYSTRAAKMIRSYYPECEIVFFYMELQNVESGDFYAGLRELGVEFINCRPSKIGETGIEYDDSSEGVKQKDFDLVILSDGIHASIDNSRLAEICRLRQDKDGFLQSVGVDPGIYVCGCARAPMKIDEAYTDAVTVACKILNCEANTR